MNKMDRNIMVIKADKLFENYPRQNGFYTQEFNFEDIILKNFEYMKRGLAEEDINFKQPLPYGVLISPDNKIFMYKRG
jgi:predicted NUDIX family phosphoesterase